MTGQIHIYTGEGKGKTTAAIGLAIRAYGAGMKVYIAQFVKGMEYNELKVLEKLKDGIEYEMFGKACLLDRKPSDEDIQLAKNRYNKIMELFKSGCKYDMVILDEFNIAIHFNLITIEEALSLIELKPQNVELIITGRNAPFELVKCADLVTEMLNIKHYYAFKKIEARKGIEF